MYFRFYSALKPKWICHVFRGHTDSSKNFLSVYFPSEWKGFQRGRKASLWTYISLLNKHIQNILFPFFFFNWTNETFLLHCNNQYKPHDAAFPKIEMPAEHAAWRCFQEEQEGIQQRFAYMGILMAVFRTWCPRSSSSCCILHKISLFQLHITAIFHIIFSRP